ncbi:MAG TPA: hypothetical protein VEV17_14395 [Bryobacteraceae bacterium]|nr:hypothetical protein [Bryobacteraceae bacterium]
MRRRWVTALRALIPVVCLSVVCLSVAYAQFDRGPHYDPHSVSVLVDQVHTDLDHAYGSFHLSGDDRGRLNHAEKELREFAQKWEDHNFDKGRLDDAISSIQHVLDNNRLPPRDRDAISDDLSQLRRMREAYDRHEIG